MSNAESAGPIMSQKPSSEKPPAPKLALATHEIQLRVRYPECDPMGVAHHATFPIWFEMGRTEMLRATGQTYRAFEEAGVFLAVVRLEVRYRRPARYDDLLRLRTELHSAGPVKVAHAYTLFRGEEVLAEATTTLACLDATGRACVLPESLTLA